MTPSQEIGLKTPISRAPSQRLTSKKVTCGNKSVKIGKRMPANGEADALFSDCYKVFDGTTGEVKADIPTTGLSSLRSTNCLRLRGILQPLSHTREEFESTQKESMRDSGLNF
jgi:hypothetical protein